MPTAKILLRDILLGSLLFLVCACAVTHSETPTIQPTLTPAELLVKIPGITEPATTFPCNYGTWDTLRFGMTTDEQLTHWLARSEFVHQASLSDGWVKESINTFEAHRYTWNVKNDGIYRTSIHLYVISGTLSSLWTPLFYPWTLGDVVSILGEPEFVSVDVDDRHEECAYFYRLYYPSQGIKIVGALYDQSICGQIIKENKGLLESAWPVTDFVCSAPGTLQDVIGAVYGILPEAAEQMTELSQPWHGFGHTYSLEP